MDANSPVPNDTTTPRLLAVIAVALVVMLGWRAYEPRFGARPTEVRTPTKTVDLNAAGRAELLLIPGVGPEMASAILNHRQAHGRFDSVEELDTLPGIGAKTLDKLRPWLTIGPGSPRIAEPVEVLKRKPVAPQSNGLVNVNAATLEQLLTLPGIGPILAERMIAERRNGTFKNVEDLRRVSGIGPKTVEKLRSHVRFE